MLRRTPGPTSRGGTAAAAAAPETVDGPPDWRGLLDLLDEHATTSLDDLWRTWVARADDLPLLDARRAARTRYDGGRRVGRGLAAAARAARRDARLAVR